MRTHLVKSLTEGKMTCDQHCEASLSAQVPSMQNLNHCEMMKKLDMEMEACEAQIENRTTGLCFSNHDYYLFINFVGFLATKWQNELLRQQKLQDSLRLHVAHVGSRRIGCLPCQSQSKSLKRLHPFILMCHIFNFICLHFHFDR